MIDLPPASKNSDSNQLVNSFMKSICQQSNEPGLNCKFCGIKIPNEQQNLILQQFHKIIQDYALFLPIKNNTLQLGQEAMLHLEPVLDFLKIDNKVCEIKVPTEKQQAILQQFFKIIHEYAEFLPIENNTLQLRSEALLLLEPVLDFLKIEVIA
jgi:hypothetical protein